MTARLSPVAVLLVVGGLGACVAGPAVEQTRAPASDCGRILTEEDEIALVRAVSAINDLYFGGGSAPHERDAEVEAVLADYSGDPERLGTAKGIVAQLNEAAAASFVMPLLLGHLDGDAPGTEDVRILTGLGVDQEDTSRYIDQASTVVAPYHRALADLGIVFRPGLGWDLSSSRLRAQDVREDPVVFTALMLFFSPALAQAAADPDRGEAVFTADSALLPPVRRGVDQGQVRGMPRQDWEREVKEWIDAFQVEVDEFLRASKDAARFWTLITGNEEAEHDKDAAYGRMIEIRNHLFEHYGIAKELKRALLEVTMQALQIDLANIESGQAKLDLAMTALLTAPLIPIALYVAPLAGGLLGPQIALVTAQAAVVLTLVPFAFAIGNAAITASIQAHHFGGDWSCWFLDAALQRSVEALYVAPYMAALPSAVASGGALVGAVTGLPALGVTAYGVLDLGVSVGFVAQMTRSGVTGLTECVEGLEHARQLADEVGEEDLVDAASAHALERCAQGGLDLGFAIVGGTALARGGIKALSSRRNGAARLELELDGRLVPLDYYEKLGVEPVATVPELKMAFQTKAAGRRGAELDALAEAYRVLTDPVARSLYDRYRADAGLAPRPPPAPPEAAVRAREVLGTEPAPEVLAAIELAHQMGAGELGRDGVRPAAVGNYRPRQLFAKARILRDAGLSWGQIRALMEAGVVGRPASALSPLGAADAAHRDLTGDLYNGTTIDARPFGANDNRNPLLWVRLHNPRTGRSVEALFKPRAWGDGFGWNRTPMEYVAYELNRMLGMDWVPPVAYRRSFDANFQRWAEGAVLYKVPEAANLADLPVGEWGARPDLFLSDARVLDVLLQNPDRHRGNFLAGRHWVTGRRRPLLIDHAASLRGQSDIRLDGTDAFGSGPIHVVRRSTLEGLRALDAQGLRARLGEFVTEAEIQGILSRRDGVVRHFEGLTAQHGHDRVVIDAVD
jgi:hypothetical protein